MHRAISLAKKLRTLTADYRTPLDAQIRQFNMPHHAFDADLLEACQSGLLRHQRLGLEEVRFELYEFEKPIMREEVVNDMAKQHAEPANITELLAFSRKHMNVQLLHTVVGLGTEVPDGGNTLVPVLTRCDNQRSIRFERTSWNPGTLFLGITLREKVSIAA